MAWSGLEPGCSVMECGCSKHWINLLYHVTLIEKMKNALQVDDDNHGMIMLRYLMLLHYKLKYSLSEGQCGGWYGV